MVFARQNLLLSTVLLGSIFSVPLNAQAPSVVPLNQMERAGAAAVPQADVIMSFHIGAVAPTAEPLMLATFAAAQPGVAQLRYRSRDDGAEVRGTVVFSSMDEFLAWRETEMTRFFSAFGQNIEIRSVRIVQPEELAKAGATDLSQIADDISIIYSNSDNESEGDADIDAVTVICGDGAQCEPSN